MSLLRRDDFFKSPFDDPFFESWDSDMKDFRKGFFKSSLLSASPAVATTVDEGAAPRALRRQKSWYDRELEAANREGDFSVSKSFKKNDAGAEVSGSLKAERTTDESADGREKAQHESSEKAMTAAAVSADGKTTSIAAERSKAESNMRSSNYVSPDGSHAASSASKSSSSSFASKSESATSSGDLLGTGSASKMASSASSSKSASSMSAASSSAMSSSSKSSKSSSSKSSSSMSSQLEASSALSSKSSAKSSLQKESLADVSLGSSSKFLAGDSVSPPSTAPPSYAESVVDDEEDCRVYYPISYKEIGRQNSIPVSQSFFTVVDGNTRKLKLQFYVGRGWDAKNVRVTAEGRKLMVRCRQGDLEYNKDINLPEEIDANLISSLLSKDGVLTVQCLFADKAVSASTVEGPIIKDEDGNKIIQLCYDVQAFDPKDVKVVLKGDMLRIHAVKEEHSATMCVKKELKRDFALPAEADKDSLVYKVDEGVLSVRIKMKESIYQRALSEEGCAGNKIHLEFDVADFEPEDVEVKLSGGTLRVAGRRREKFEKNAQVLDFSRECVVPTWVDSDSLRSYLTPAGKLTIEVPMEKTVRSELHFNVNQ